MPELSIDQNIFQVQETAQNVLLPEANGKLFYYIITLLDFSANLHINSKPRWVFIFENFKIFNKTSKSF